MPPPKKPKSGRTSLEQFLTDEERGQVINPRDLRDSEGHSPAGSLDLDGSDGEVFSGYEEVVQRSKSVPNEGETGHNPAILLKTFLRKSRSVDEQKVPGSPDERLSTANSTPTELGGGDCYPGFGKYLDETEETAKTGSDQTPHSDPRSSPPTDPLRVSDESKPNSGRAALTKEQDRLLDTLVASALASSVAQSIIHSRSAPNTYTGAMPNFMYGQRGFTNSVNGFDSEPHDLSKRTETNHHTKLLDHRLYDNLHNTGDRKKFHQPYRDWGTHDVRAVTVDRSKHYLESHKRIAGLLSEMDTDSERGRDTTPMQILEKENIINPVPVQHINGYFHPLGLHARMSGDLARFEHRQR